MLDSPLRFAMFAVVVVMAGGIREEVQRAFILHRFRQDLGGVWMGLVVFSVAFGLGHVVQGYDAAILTGVLGLLWGLVYVARRSIVAPVVSHSMFNLTELAIFYYAAQSGLIGS
jgi:membrane protease YdiL (CAAX protease family)